jgi:hypothetical protein
MKFFFRFIVLLFSLTGAAQKSTAKLYGYMQLLPEGFLQLQNQMKKEILQDLKKVYGQTILSIWFTLKARLYIL